MTYKDVIEAKMILPKKPRYTIRDYCKLREKGFSIAEARFIVICSAIYHDTTWSKSMDSLEKLQIKEYTGGPIC